MTKFLMLFSILLPAVTGMLLPVVKMKNRNVKLMCMAASLILTALSSVCVAVRPAEWLVLFSMTDKLTVSLCRDTVSGLFLMIASFGFLFAGIFAFRYMDHEEKEGAFSEDIFFCFFFLSLAALIGMDLADNLIAMYFFFEMITLLSMPMVLYERTRKSITAALKYLFYSVAGAFLALFGIIYLAAKCDSVTFVKGGFLGATALAEPKLVCVMVLLMVIGFGAKGGMYPLHAWLPTAHPVAPAPASAVLSAIIAKAGVLAILRILYFSVGTELLRGSFVQTTLLTLSLLTVFLGSMMAYREKVFKKRLAYSSVSQISYALFGLFLMTPDGVRGGLMQIVFHATVKICLFLTAGSVINNRHVHEVDEMKGFGRIMPYTFGAFTLASLSLIGIPPFAGFVSKWYLAMGALNSGIAVFDVLGPAILLISALLTAGYLLPISIAAFFPGKDAEVAGERREGGLLMVMPLLVLAGLSLLFGLLSGLMAPWFTAMVGTML